MPKPSMRTQLSRPRAFRLYAIILSMLAGAVVSAHAQVTFSNIVDTTTVAPNRSVDFTGFNPPALSGSTAVFYGISNAGAGMYTGTVGTAGAIYIADTSTLAPGQTVNYNGFSNLPAASGSAIAFQASFSGSGTSGSGIYTGTAGVAGATRVADTTTAVPGQSGSFTSLSTGSPGLSGSTVVFCGLYTGGKGIYTGTAGTTGAVRVADTSTAAPGQTVNFSGFGSTPQISGSTVVFQGSSVGSGIYTGTVGTTGAVRVADINTAVPNQSGTFTNLLSPAISGNTLGFYGTYNGGSGTAAGLYTAQVGTTNLGVVADFSTAVPRGSGDFLGFTVLSLSGTSEAAFTATYTGGGQGLFLKVGDTLTAILLKGDSFMGGTVSSVTLSPNGLDGTELGFAYRLTSGVQGVAVADISSLVVPEPGTWALLVCGLVLFGVMRRCGASS